MISISLNIYADMINPIFSIKNIKMILLNSSLNSFLKLIKKNNWNYKKNYILKTIKCAINYNIFKLKYNSLKI